MENVYEVIKKYNKKDIYPFHMPGHKRIPQEIFKDVHPYEVDYTEVDGLDDLLWNKRNLLSCQWEHVRDHGFYCGCL